MTSDLVLQIMNDAVLHFILQYKCATQRCCHTFFSLVHKNAFTPFYAAGFRVHGAILFLPFLYLLYLSHPALHPLSDWRD